MRKLFFICVIFFVFQTLFSQSDYLHLELLIKEKSGAYVDVVVDSKADVQKLIDDFSIERGDVKLNNEKFNVKIWITHLDFKKFKDKKIPFSIDIDDLEKEAYSPTLTMATTVAQMVSWNRYPTYSVYLQMMQNFQTDFPNFCKIDTIHSQTTKNHAVLAAKVGNLNDNIQNKPAFLYSAAMHGDEICGYVTMLRLIDYILNNQSDPLVSSILNNIDLYICPLENPDGTFPSNNNVVSGSVRSNAAGYDLNRYYPNAGYAQQPISNIAEINSMLSFIKQKSIIMSANCHGGAELYNYAWDFRSSAQLKHPDKQWWIYVGNKFVDTLRKYAPSSYFTDQGGVTNGGDWYVIDGSRLDCLNYYKQCRDVTLEISSDKKVAASLLPNYWNYLYRSLLHYAYESSLGFSGIITDSITNQPLEALAFITSHDNNQSCVYSFLPSGKYHRPILSGNYSVIYSAPGYHSKTYQVQLTEGALQIQNVELVSITQGISKSDLDSYITVYPNPSSNFIIIEDHSNMFLTKELAIFDIKGTRVFSSVFPNESMTISLENFESGLYFISLKIDDQLVVRKFIKK